VTVLSRDKTEMSRGAGGGWLIMV